jgi:phage/plasmid-like protein (TIGR03299 family)
MSHEVERMAYVGETPWHGLGEKLTGLETIEQWQVAAGLNWDVLENSVLYFTDPPGNLSLREATTRKVLFRSDTLEPLSVVSKVYKPVQPKEILEFYRDLVADLGFTIETAGSLKNGLKVWALAKTNESTFLAAQDEVRSYLLLATSYDGTFATTGQFENIRVVCNNTLQMALSKTLDAVKIGHREEFNPTEVKALLGLGGDAFATWRSAAEALTKIQVNAVKATGFYRDVMGVPTDNTAVLPRQLAAKNLADRLTETFVEGKYIGSDLESSNGTAWGLVNVTTEYLDHVRRQSKPGNRLNDAWFGNGAQIKQRAWERAVELVE